MGRTRLGGKSILITGPAYGELLGAANLAADRFSSACKAVQQFCLESPTYREYAAKAQAAGQEAAQKNGRPSRKKPNATHGRP